MRTASRTLALVLATWPAVTALALQNLLRDADFGGPSGAWSPTGNAARYRVVAKGGRKGTKGLKYEKPPGAADPKENSHYDQVVAVKPDTVYIAGMWVKAEGRLRPVLRIADMEWQTLAVSAAGETREWQEVRTLFRSGKNRQIRFQIFGGSIGEIRQTEVGVSCCDDAFVRLPKAAERQAWLACRVRVEPEKVLREIDPLFFGSNFLFMVDDDASLADGKLAERLREVPIRLLRYPGGDMADNYHWKTHSLDDPKWWPSRQGPDTTDTDEFMGFCRKVGAEPIFVVNLESGFVHNDLAAAAREAAEWVGYCNKEKGYNVKYWEIGNETYIYNPGPKHRHKRAPVSARQYADAYLRFSQAMKAVDPTIKTGAVGSMYFSHVARLGDKSDEAPWWPTVIGLTRETLDFIVVHQYFMAEYGNRLRLAEAVAQHRTYLREQIPDRYVQIALTEWNVNKRSKSRGISSALVLAEAIAEYIRGGVDLACLWPMRYRGWEWAHRGLLDIEKHAPIPNYHVMKLFSSHVGKRLVAATVSNAMVYAFASTDGGRQTIFLVNRSVEKEGITCRIESSSPQPRGASAIVLTAPTLDSDQITVVPLAVAPDPGGWTCTLPPHSLTVASVRP